MTVDGTRRGHVVVCGLRGLGLRVVEQLHATGRRVVVVDDVPDRRGASLLESLGVALVVADATTPEALGRVDVAHAAAVVCVEDGAGGDLRNLQIALLVRDRHPDVRVVAALGNAAVARAMADEGPGVVLDVATLATPSLVEACLRSPVHELDVAGRRFLAAETVAPGGATLRSLYGDLAPLSVAPAPRDPAPRDPARAVTGWSISPSGPDQPETGASEPVTVAGGAPEDGAPEVCPGRDHRVEEGDDVVLLGTVPELVAAGVDVSVPEPGQGREPATPNPLARRVRRAGATLRQVGRELDRGLRWALLALVGLIAISTAVLRLGYTDPGMTAVDALYFTVESVATVGFGDYSFAEQPLWLRLWAIFLMLAGVATTAVPLAFLTDLLISRRLAATAGRRKAAGSTGHVVVVGLGTVGIAVVAALRERGRDVVVLERDPANRFLDRARALDVPVVFGDATSADTLRAARVGRAAAVAIVTSDDMANIETGLAVRDALGERWPDVPVVLRIYDRELGHTVARRFGFAFVRSVVELAAPWFVGAALGLDVLGTFPVHGRAFLLGRLVVAPGGGLDGLAMQELSARTRVVGLRRAGTGTLEHPPRRDTRFGAGDEAFLVGPYEELLEVLSHGRRAAMMGP